MKNIIAMGLLGVCAAGACWSPGSAEAGRMGEGELVETVMEGGNNWLADDLRIATGNFDQEDYLLDDGDARTGWTAGLWVSTPEAEGDGWVQVHERVHAGTRLRVPGYRLEVIDVTKSLRRGIVRLRVEPLRPVER